MAYKCVICESVFSGKGSGVCTKMQPGSTRKRCGGELEEMGKKSEEYKPARGKAQFRGSLSEHASNVDLKNFAENVAVGKDDGAAKIVSKAGVSLRTCFHKTSPGSGLKQKCGFQTIFYVRTRKNKIIVIGLGNHAGDNQHYDIDWEDGKTTKDATFA
jgi:hypothetical protein